jgi:hypothetical protein
MAGITCASCGASLQGDGPASVHCEACNASAIEKRKNSHQARVTRSAPNDGVCSQGPRKSEPFLLPSADDDPTPSILREYHYSFLRVFVYSIFWTAAVIAFLAFMLMAS